MNTITPLLQPIVDIWAYFTDDREFKKLTANAQDWHTKFIFHERNKVNQVFKEQYQKFYSSPELFSTFFDNIWRFSLFAGAERLIALRQGQDFLKNRYLFENNTIGAIDAIRSNGIIGSFKGNFWNVLYFFFVPYQSLKWADGDSLKYIGISCLFEALFYPIDTIRTLNYLDVNKSFKNTWDLVRQTIDKSGYTQFYKGLPQKIQYNLAFGFTLWSYCNESPWLYLAAPLWIFSYAFLTLKTRSQISGSPLSALQLQSNSIASILLKKEGFRGLYSGLAPFIALNVLFLYNFPSLWSDSKKKRYLEAIKGSAPPDRIQGGEAF